MMLYDLCLVHSNPCSLELAYRILPRLSGKVEILQLLLILRLLSFEASYYLAQFRWFSESRILLPLRSYTIVGRIRCSYVGCDNEEN